MQRFSSSVSYLRKRPKTSLFALAAVASALLISCTSGGGNTSGSGGCNGSCVNAESKLLVSDVQQIISQAVHEARARNANATIAVTDRVGRVLAVFDMNGSEQLITASTNPNASTSPNGQRGADGGLEGVSVVPSTAAAISKSVTASYLSSEGNAFTTRTASQIVQDHFNPGEFRQPGGPLFGVQFSQLACSDLVLRDEDGSIGPKRSPLGLSADPGGLPLYKNGVPVGGVGIISDDLYSLDPNVTGAIDKDQDEIIALAATVGFQAPTERRADRITVDGKILRFSDAELDDLASNPANAEAFDAINGTIGNLRRVNGYIDNPIIREGSAFTEPASGIRAATEDFDDLDGFVLVDGSNQPRFPPTTGTDAIELAGIQPLQPVEVKTVLREALKIANRARAQIRRPLGDPARVSIFVVDTKGQILGMVRGRDAPIFGLDVSLQKARTAVFFSSERAADYLNSLPDAAYLVNNDQVPPRNTPVAALELRRETLSQYVEATRSFLGSDTALADGAFAFADRSGGNLSRPFFPDGVEGTPNGPLSKPAGEWSPFSTGLQLDLVYNDIIRHVLNILGARVKFEDVDGDGNDDLVLAGPNEGIAVPDVPRTCTGTDPLGNGLSALSPAPDPTTIPISNGIQIFPGSVPIYRGDQLVGGIGVSGDGIDQDDMISFLGLHNAGVELGTINNAPKNIRADQLIPMGTRLRFINCPQAPFNDSDEQEPCRGK